MRRKEYLSIGRIGNVRINEKAIGFLMNTFHGHLESIKTAGFRYGHFATKSFRQIFHHNPIGSGKERQDHTDEMAFRRCQGLPIGDILREINFVGRPKGRDMLLVHVPQIGMLNGKQGKA
jgi:hypothetical protein